MCIRDSHETTLAVRFACLSQRWTAAGRLRCSRPLGRCERAPSLTPCSGPPRLTLAGLREWPTQAVSAPASAHALVGEAEVPMWPETGLARLPTEPLV
eukprot:2666873-Rhodomonas_salina.1